MMMVVALFGVLTPGLARGEDARGTALTIVTEVTRLNDEKQYAHAATLAAAGVAREDLADADRVQLAGLARRSFDLSYQTGGALTDLCGLAAVMQLAAPLDTAEGGAVKRAEAAKAEARLEQVAGPGWRAVCAPADASASASSADPERDAQEARPVDPTPATPTTSAPSRDVNTARPARPASLRDRRRVGAGVGTLLPGLLLFAPMAGVLVRRGAAERELKALHAGSAGERLSDDARGQVEALNQRYRATTVGAAVLGAAGAALAVTGVVLLATNPRRARVAVAPWGGRGIGGLVLEGRF